jgi:hypothetical protein
MLTNHQMDSGAPFAALLLGQPVGHQRLRCLWLTALMHVTDVIDWSFVSLMPLAIGRAWGDGERVSGRRGLCFWCLVSTLLEWKSTLLEWKMSSCRQVRWRAS